MGISHDIRPKKVYRPNNHQNNTYKHVHREDHTADHFDVPEFMDFERKSKLEDDFFQNNPEPKRQKHDFSPKIKKINRILSAKKLVWFFGLIVVFIVLYQNFDQVRDSLLEETTSSATNEDKKEEYVSQSTTETPTEQTTKEAATATPSTQNNSATTTPMTATQPEDTKADLAIKVLNGNGISNSADSVKKTLINAGYTIDKVANAKSFSYTKTYIYHKTGKEKEANAIQIVLSGRNCIIEKSDSIVGTYDIIVVVGKQ